ncbi:hypothetical protein D3C85_1200500 [compost metagenome]
MINAIIPTTMLKTDKIADQTIKEMADPKLELDESAKLIPASVHISMIKKT